LDPRQYLTAVIATTSADLAAVCALFESQAAPARQADSDLNAYCYGRIASVDVVVAPLPAGQTGSEASTAAIQSLLSSFANLRSVLSVGTCGAVAVFPAPEDLRVGDIVVGTSVAKKSDDHSDLVIEKLRDAGKYWSSLTSVVEANILRRGSGAAAVAQEIAKKLHARLEFEQRTNEDVLFAPETKHAGGDCSKCGQGLRRREVSERRMFSGPIVAMSIIDAGLRDEVYQASPGQRRLLCADLSAGFAGGSEIRFLVIRGISHYCDQLCCRERAACRVRCCLGRCCVVLVSGRACRETRWLC
jgi:nucleoside phosphorylase